jgi:hypothetical protein
MCQEVFSTFFSSTGIKYVIPKINFDTTNNLFYRLKSWGNEGEAHSHSPPDREREASPPIWPDALDCCLPCGSIAWTEKARLSRRYLKRGYLAHFETIQTGNRVETHIRGRVFRYAPKQPKGLQRPPASKELRRVCVLDGHHGAMLERWGVDQPCHGPRCTHRHHTRAEVEKLVRDGILKYVAGSQRNVAVYVYGRIWKGVPSGGPQGAKVMQLV